MTQIRDTRCVSCGEDLSTSDYYHINPPGGYGREEIRICIPCLKLPENTDYYNRLYELNVLEERDKH